MNLARDNYPEIRNAVRSLCEQFDSAYWQRIDEARAYPEEFVDKRVALGKGLTMKPIRNMVSHNTHELFFVAPISTNLILAHLAEHVLGLRRSF